MGDKPGGSTGNKEVQWIGGVSEKNKEIKTCEALSKNLEFVEEMKNCENFKKFIQNEVEDTYRKLINPPQNSDLTN